MKHWYLNVQITREAIEELNIGTILNLLKKYGQILLVGHYSTSIISILKAKDGSIEILQKRLDRLPIIYAIHPFKLSLFEPQLLSQITKSEKSSAFFVKLIPPRKTFVNDITSEEQQVMKAHFEYLKSLQERQKLILAGPCLDEGSYGVIILKESDMKEVRKVLQAEPSLQAGLMTAKAYEIEFLKNN